MIGPVSFVDLAGKLDEVPWDVLSLCRYLVRRGVAEEQPGEPRGIFSADQGDSHPRGD